MKKQFFAIVAMLLLPLCVSAESIRVSMNRELGFMKTPYYTMSWYEYFPMMSFFGVESGGRSHHYCERNFLRPGLGSTVFCEGENSFGVKSSKLRMHDNVFSYDSISFEKNTMSMDITAQDEHVFDIKIDGKNGKVNGQVFRMAFAPDVVPFSVWSDKAKLPLSDEYDRPPGLFSPTIDKASYRLPAVFTFPDFGNVLVEASSEDVYIQEHFVPDWDNAGQNLGQGDLHGHKARKAFHLGEIMLSFHTLRPVDGIHLKFTVLPENYPHIEGVDLSDSRFDGLKRCWQNMFALNPGSMTVADNILLLGQGHVALYFKADMLPFTPDYDTSYNIHDGVRWAIEFALKYMIEHSNHRLRGFGTEGTESTLISLYDFLVATGDWSLYDNYKESVLELVDGVLDSDADGDGILEDPFNGNRMKDVTSVCWWDDFAFGHKNAYRNLMAYRAMKQMLEIYAIKGETHRKADVERFVNEFPAKFHQTFYNPKSGLYAGWKSEDGRLHDYAFTFISGMATYLDVIPQRQAKKVLRKLLKLMRQAGYDFVYGVPGNAIEVAREDRIGWDEMCRWGRYENGGLSGQTAYHFLQALYHVGMREEADDILFKMLATFERDYTHSGINPGYQQSVDWRTKGGEPSGYNYLADNYYFLLAAITGHFGKTIGPLKK